MSLNMVKNVKDRSDYKYVASTGIVMKKNRIIRSVMMLLFMTALVFGWTALLHADGNLMHNSDRFGECSNSAYDGTSQAECEGAGGTWTSTSQWSGNWGLSGGKYGAITCETCHVDTDTNIKMIRISQPCPGLVGFCRRCPPCKTSTRLLLS